MTTEQATKPTPEPGPRTTLNRPQKTLIGIVVAGVVIIAAIGFAGSYAAVRDLAARKGFGAFATWFPLGVDAGIVVLLALDLLLTWLRIPFPLLRHTAWLLTAATIAFNGAAAWPDPLGVGMHSTIPLLFVVAVEAARHAIGRIADITADKHMEGVRLSRWLLAFPSTFRLWRRMKLWELRSYDEVIKLEQDRLVYRARLRARYGRAWRRRAPVEAVMPLRLLRYGVPLLQAQQTTAGTPVVRNTAPTLSPRNATPEPATPNHATPATPIATPDVATPVAPLPATRNTATLDVATPNATPPVAPLSATRNGATPEPTATPQQRDAATPDTSHLKEVIEEAARNVAADLDGSTLLTTADVARLKGVSTGTVRSWVNRGRLKPRLRDANGRNHFHPADVAELD